MFTDIKRLDDDFRSQIFGTLDTAGPRAGLQALERILAHLSVDELKSFNAGRRHVVSALNRIAWVPETFQGAALLLLQLAEAENEPYKSNATAIWCRLFQTRLGGTAVPAMARQNLLKQTLESTSSQRRLLVVKALGASLKTHESPDAGAENQRGRLTPPEWRPKNHEEDIAVRRSALRLLDRAAEDRDEEVLTSAVEQLCPSARSLVAMGLADEVIQPFQRFGLKDEEMRRKGGDASGSILCYESEVLDDRQRNSISKLHEKLTGTSYCERLRRWVGEWSHTDWLITDKKREKSPEQLTEQLADEGHAHPELLKPELAWLASSGAKQIWFFAKRLGAIDKGRVWLPELVSRARKKSGRRVV